jgi:hypothetical protein
MACFPPEIASSAPELHNSATDIPLVDLDRMSSGRNEHVCILILTISLVYF